MFKKIILVMMLLATSAFASQIKWAKDYNSGIKEATKQNKPVLFVYSRHTCKYCVLLEDTTFRDKKVIESLNNDYIAIVSYTDENDYTPRMLQTPGTPAIWFLLPDGEPMYQPLMGAMDAENFLKATEIIKKEFDNLNKTGK